VLELGEDEGGAGYLGGAFLVRVPISRSWFPAGFFTGVRMPVRAPSQPLPASAGIPRAAAR
jgi:hypothetical protein